MAVTLDVDTAKDRLVESLSSARDVAIIAVREDIAPAVIAAAAAARDAAGPAYAEASTRASDAVTALKTSDAAKNIRASSSDAAKTLMTSSSDAAKAIRESSAAKSAKKATKSASKSAAKTLKKKRRRAKTKRVGFLLGLLGVGAAGFAVMKKRSAPTADTYAAATSGVHPVPDAESPETTESTSETA